MHQSLQCLCWTAGCCFLLVHCKICFLYSVYQCMRCVTSPCLLLQVSITTEDGENVQGKGLSRKLIDQLYKTYSSDLDGKRLAFDGDKTLYTVGPLPQNDFDFQVILEASFSKRYGPLLLSGFIF